MNDIKEEQLIKEIEKIYNEMQFGEMLDTIDKLEDTPAGRLFIGAQKLLDYPLIKSFQPIFVSAREKFPNNRPFLKYSVPPAFFGYNGIIREVVLVADNNNKLRCFTLEKTNGLFLCEYLDGKHVNYGILEIPMNYYGRPFDFILEKIEEIFD